MHVEIILTRGKVAIVDAADFPLLNEFKWYAAKGKNTWYAARFGGTRKPSIFMHRQILGCSGELEVDHGDGNGLNNCRYNLRACTHAQNIHNSPKQSGTASRFKGVHLNRGLWCAAIEVSGQKTFLGSFDSEIAAAKQYDRAARLSFGRFARTNEMMGLFEGAVDVIAPRRVLSA